MIEREAQDVLDEAALQVEASGKKSQCWSLVIPPTRSLRFKRTEVDNRISLDLYCMLRLSEDAIPLAEQSVVLRIWSEDLALSYRVDWDAPIIEKKLMNAGVFRRVLARLHFDRAPPGVSEPRFHLQYGGHSTDERELSWSPANLAVPRIPASPVEVILACQIILANFFPRTYSVKRDEPQWRALICKAEMFVVPYHELCHSVCQSELADRKTLLECLWNT